MKAVALEDVCTSYEGEKRPAIKDISLSLEKGEMLLVAGPNGAGKTTLLETILGLLPFSGRVYVFGVDVKRNGSSVRKRIGYVPQDFIANPLEPFKAIDVVLMGRYGKIGPFKSPRKEDYEKAYEALRLVGVEAFAQRPIGKLSGGQQQKVVIARALAKEPELLLLDEPFSNLDAKSRREILDLLYRLNEELGTTVIMVNHDFSLLSRWRGRVLYMESGRVVVEGSPEDLVKYLEGSRWF